MNHSFTPSQINNEKCARCHFTEIDHTSRATCEACGNTGTCEVMYGNMLLCMDCQDKEKALQKENNSPEKQAQRLQEHARKVDESIQFKSDLYNAETVSHIEVFKAIDADTNITNKTFAKAQFLKDRFDHFSKIVFDARSTLEVGTNAQRAIKTQLDEISNKLRQDERDKLKLQDTSYIVDKPKTVKPKTTSPKKPAWTMADIREAAADFKVPIDAVAMVSRARNMHPKDAAFMLAKQIHGSV